MARGDRRRIARRARPPAAWAPVGIAVFLLGLALFFFAGRMPARTAGERRCSRKRRVFASTSGRPRRTAALRGRQDTFSRHLPYTVVFGETDRWVKSSARWPRRVGGQLERSGTAGRPAEPDALRCLARRVHLVGLEHIVRLGHVLVLGRLRLLRRLLGRRRRRRWRRLLVREFAGRLGTTPDAGCCRLPRPSRHDLPRHAHRPRAAGHRAGPPRPERPDVQVRATWSRQSW